MLISLILLSSIRAIMPWKSSQRRSALIKLKVENHAINLIKRVDNYNKNSSITNYQFYGMFHKTWTSLDGQIQKWTMNFWGLIIGRIVTFTCTPLLPHVCKRTMSMWSATLWRATFTRQSFLTCPSRAGNGLIIVKIGIRWASAQLVPILVFLPQKKVFTTIPAIDVEY